MNPLSQFLPDNFDASARLSILAGRGEYPKLLAHKLKDCGLHVYITAFEDETAPEFLEEYVACDRADIINVGQLGKLLKALKKRQIRYAIMAGQITPKKLFKGLKLDLKAMLVMATLKRRNAETIFGAIASEMSKIGVELLDARSFLDDSLAPKGFFSGKKWNISDDSLNYAMTIAREMARLDIGQSCVVARGSVLAVEAWEGTDSMIERAGTFGARDCLFAKTVKPNQDYRFDVPVIGERTVRKLAAANIRNVVVEAGKVLILDKARVKALAEANDIKIYGI